MASLAFPKKKKRTRTDDDSDSESENEIFFMKDNWPRFVVVQSANEERPLSKLSPFAVQKGFQAIAGTCLLYTSPSPRDSAISRMPSSA